MPSRRFQRQSDECRFVGVGMNNGWADLQRDAQAAPCQPNIQVQFVARRSNHSAPDPGHIPRATNIEARHVVAVVVGRQHQPMPELLNGFRLLPDAHMVAVIRKKLVDASIRIV